MRANNHTCRSNQHGEEDFYGSVIEIAGQSDALTSSARAPCRCLRCPCPWSRRWGHPRPESPSVAWSSCQASTRASELPRVQK